jgi:hypothetical protein
MVGTSTDFLSFSEKKEPRGTKGAVGLWPLWEGSVRTVEFQLKRVPCAQRTSL